ncbi:hypothetical protein [Escherichia coli]|uniref:hypothetical protein n=1 Tax=Escherichia coli TaxID=562 RepID=UPI00203FD201|nr:hypothetical protein [Escherichia coli]
MFDSNFIDFARHALHPVFVVFYDAYLLGLASWQMASSVLPILMFGCIAAADLGEG